MPAPVEVQVVASLDSNALNRAGQQISRSLGTVAKDFDQNLQRAEKRILSFTSVAGVIYTVQKGFTELVKSTIEVEKSLTDINVIAQTSTREIKKFGDELFRIAKETNQSFTSVAGAAVELSRQGLNLQETLKRTKDALVLVQLAGISSEDAVSSLTATINSFSKSMLTSTDIVNKFAAVDAKFAVSSADLAEAVKRVGSSAQEAGVSLDELVAIVTSAQQTTARGGAVIGNALKTIFQKIERPQVLEQLEELGVATKDANQEMLPTIKILTDLANRYDGLAQSQKSQVAEMVGGIYQVNILKATLSDLEKGAGSAYLNAFNTAVNAGDVAIRRSEELNQSLSAVINRTKLNLGQLGASVGGQTLSPLLKNVLGDFNSLFENLNEKAKDGGENIGKNLLIGITNTLLVQGGTILITYFAKIAKDLALAASGALTNERLLPGASGGGMRSGGFSRGGIAQVGIGTIPFPAGFSQPGGFVPGRSTAFSQQSSRYSVAPFNTPPPFYTPAQNIPFGQQVRNGYGQFVSPWYSAPQNTARDANTQALISSFSQNAKISNGSSFFSRADNWIGRNIAAKPGVGFGLSFGVPMLANTIASSIGTDTLERRRTGGLISGFGNIASMGAMGAMATGSAAGGLAAAGGTAIVELYRASKSWSDTLPELIERLEEAKRKTSELEAGFLGFIRSSDTLKDPGVSLTRAQIMRLENERDNSLQRFLPEERAQITAAYINGDSTAASNIYSKINAKYANQKIIEEIGVFAESTKKAGGLFTSPGAFSDPFSEFQPTVTTKGSGKVEDLRAFLSSITNTEGQGIQGLLTKNEVLRNSVFTEVEKGTEEGIISGLTMAFKELGQSDETINSLLASFDKFGAGLKPILLNNIFGGNLSKSSLVSLSQSGKTAEYLRKNAAAQRGDADLYGFNAGVGINALSMRSVGELQARSLGAEGAFDIFQTKQLGGLDSFGGSQSIGLARMSGISSSAARQRAELQNQLAYQAKSYQTSIAIANERAAASAKQANYATAVGFQESLTPNIINYIRGESKRGMESGNYGAGHDAVARMAGIQKNLGAYSMAVSDGNNDEAFGAFNRLTFSLGSRISALTGKTGGKEVRESEILKSLLEQVNSLEEKRKQTLSQIEQTKTSSLDKAKKENEAKEEPLRISKELLEINLANERIFNVEEANYDIVTNAMISQQKLTYAGGLYKTGRIGSGELDASRATGIEGFRSAYGVDRQLESANRYSAFKNQFSYNEIDKMRELEKSAVDLGATMKSSFSDAFKAFSMGTQSAGQAFQSFGMGILDKISSIVSNISTNMLFGAIGSLMPSSNFGNLLSQSMRSGGLVTGGSGVRDDVPKMLSSGDYVLQKSAVNKYGVSFAASLNNSYDYNHPTHPTAGSFNIDPRLSSFALEDENNPQNALRSSREQGLMSYIKEKEQYDATKAAAMRQYRNAQNQRLIGAYISAGIMIGGAGIRSSGGGLGKDSFGQRIPAGGYNYPSANSYSQVYIPGHALGGVIGGSSRGDTVPAMLMGGEYVIRRDAVNRLGVPLLNQINAGRYAAGGLVLPGPNTQVGNQAGMQDSILALLQSINLLKQTIDKPSGQTSGVSKTDSGINYYSNISINLNKTGEPTVQTETKSTGGNKNNDKDNVEALKKFSNMIDAKIYEAFNKESKPGGLLRNVLAA